LKIICIGRNYYDHIKELNNNRSKEPIIFMKPDSSIIPKNQPFFIPAFSNNIHHEVELVIKINRIGKHIDKKFAHKYYRDLTVGLDFTARDIQNELRGKGFPWEKSKGFDNSALIGEWLNKGDFSDINNIDFHLTKNDKICQNSNSSKMIWKIDEIISYVSKFFTLKIGDLIFTGTPSGVSKLVENDILEGFIQNKKCFNVKIK